LYLTHWSGTNMPTYPLIHKTTGEKQELRMTMKEYDQWLKDNPDWHKDWQAGVGNHVTEVGDWRDKMSKTHPGWKDVIGRVGKVDKGFDRRGYQW